jgi:hypothetical protein
MTPTDKITEYLAHVKELEEKATPGPWDERCAMELSNSEVPRHVWGEYGWVAHCYSPVDYAVPDAQFIAASRQIIPTLREALEVAVETLEYLEGATHPFNKWGDEAFTRIREIIEKQGKI